MLTMTEKAADKVRHYAEQMEEARGKELRIYVQGGGCSGFQYGFTFDEYQDGDTVVEAGGVKVLMDPMSLQYLNGATVDFVEDVRGSGFLVDNPSVARTCGCGNSPQAE